MINEIQQNCLHSPALTTKIAFLCGWIFPHVFYSSTRRWMVSSGRLESEWRFRRCLVPAVPRVVTVDKVSKPYNWPTVTTSAPIYRPTTPTMPPHQFQQQDRRQLSQWSRRLCQRVRTSRIIFARVSFFSFQWVDVINYVYSSYRRHVGGTVAAVKRRKRRDACKLLYVELHTSRNTPSANKMVSEFLNFRIPTHSFAHIKHSSNIAAWFYARCSDGISPHLGINIDRLVYKIYIY